MIIMPPWCSSAVTQRVDVYTGKGAEVFTKLLHVSLSVTAIVVLQTTRWLNDDRSPTY